MDVIRAAAVTIFKTHFTHIHMCGYRPRPVAASTRRVAIINFQTRYTDKINLVARYPYTVPRNARVTMYNFYEPYDYHRFKYT